MSGYDDFDQLQKDLDMMTGQEKRRVQGAFNPRRSQPGVDANGVSASICLAVLVMLVAVGQLPVWVILLYLGTLLLLSMFVEG